MSDLPTAQAFLTQPAYTKFWQDMAVEGPSEPGRGADAGSRRLLGPGRHVGHAGGVRRAEAARLRARGVPGAGAVEPRRLGGRQRAQAGIDVRAAGLRRADGNGVPQDDGVPVLREVSEGQARLRPGRYGQLSHRREQVGTLRRRGRQWPVSRRRGCIWSRASS